MFGLIHRDTLPPFVVDEFENLNKTLSSFLLAEHNEDGTHRPAATSREVPPGLLTMYIANTAPTGWLICDGSAVSRITYADLFAVISTTYGAGDGSLTFNLPDLRQRFPLGKAASGTGSSLASSGGAIDHAHSGGTVSGSTANESSHTHSQVQVLTGGPLDTVLVDNNGGGSTVAVGSGTHTHQTDADTTGAGSAHLHGAGTLAVGTSGAENPPFLVINFIIKT